MKVKLLISLAIVSAFASPVTAQTTKVLKGSEITESALIEALSPEGGIRTRSIKVLPGEQSPAEKAGSASLVITFHTNSSTLTPEAKQSLDVVGRALNMDKLARYDFDLVGHADPTGGHEYNQKLSEARAETVKDYLVQHHNIEEDRLMAIGRGDRELLNKENPVAPENRRVTIVTKVK
jgi:outer membrane protein OmpA-like peptidoglycan-associated protein